MQPFDDITPEETNQQNEALIAFLRQVSHNPVETTEPERMQALTRVRERLLNYDDYDSAMTQESQSPTLRMLSKTSRSARAGGSDSVPPLRQGRKQWSTRLRMIAAVAVIILLVGSMAVVLRLIQQSRIQPANRANLTTLATFSGTGSQTLTSLNIAVPNGWTVEFSCNGPGSNSFFLRSKYQFLGDAGPADSNWQHPKLMNIGSDSCSYPALNPTPTEGGQGGYIVDQAQITVDPTTSWKLTFIAGLPTQAPKLHLPAISLPENQVVIGNYAGKGQTGLLTSGSNQFHPNQPWQMYLVCSGPGKVNVLINGPDVSGAMYKADSKYKLSANEDYTVQCNESVKVSKLFPPSLDPALIATINVEPDSNITLHWIMGMCIDNSAGCQPPTQKS